MKTANDVLSVARGQIGYREGKNNDNKYGKAYGWNNVAWCVQFVWWVFKQAGCPNLFLDGGKTASCSALFSFHKKQSVSPNALKPGDIVFFDFSGAKKATSHVGIVEAVNGSNITTIEGNTGGGSETNGDGVYRKLRNVKHISCAYRPAYDGVSKVCGYSSESFIRDVQRAIGANVDGEVGKETRGKLPIIKTSQNALNSSVCHVQTRLWVLGYDVGKSGADGEYGGDTARAVIAFQKDHGLLADGELGADTWDALFVG